MNVTVAGAPVSFGVFEMTPDGAATLSADDILDILAETGYAGVDLGPLGFLGRGRVLRDRLASRGLELAGGWVELPFTDDEAFRASLLDLDAALAVFSEAAEAAPRRLPKPTLADSGSPERRRAPGSGIGALDPSGWERLAANAAIAADRVRAAGFEPTFHHHAGTFVESPEEIGVFLERVDVGLTLDTGHLLIGGGDPVAALTAWAGRINHLHLKDVDRSELHAVLSAGGGMREVWSSGAFVAFGSGDIDLAAVLAAVEAIGFDGWIVVEQDVLPAPDVSLPDFRRSRAADQKINRDALRPWC
ncbi:sugar phosphate isomerase/epimerase [Leifsonia shinshuensis]|uniref:sugar phosphate isomerase/epimerase family protein n=1 Tax=Leifsonia TaxID=110932 RepID=UPI00285B3CB2|nr:sugar phosphate isomerase/epimerase [Leifsonia shinshuensis]MDR6971637.1 inosose dehydratase [Leifsonia shinshuensis]